nr:hypothetical protein Iba_chr04eCG14520 [Ipomoea batatas]
MGNLTSHEPTIFWILKSLNLAGKPSFWMILAYLRAANFDCCSLFAPVQTYFPRSKNQCCCFWFSNPHNDCSKTLNGVFRIPSLQRNGFKIQFAVQVHS